MNSLFIQSKHTNKPPYLKSILLGSCLFIGSLQASESHHSNSTDDMIKKFYQQPMNKDLDKRIAFSSYTLLDKPYQLGALGEGTFDVFDQEPLYRLDAFDCETYVDTVLALAFATNLESFQYYIKHIRYQNGHVSFIDRNHFTCIDWNKNNQKMGYLKDITPEITDKNHKKVAMFAHTMIDKPNWYQHFIITRIRLNHTPKPNEQQMLLTLLKQKGQTLSKTPSSIPYLPFTALFDNKGHANLTVFRQIPNGAVIEIVRPNWDLTKAIGTHLNISHLGLAIWKNNTLFFREASSVQHKVIDSPFIPYLYNLKKNPTIQGINVQIALPSYPKFIKN